MTFWLETPALVVTNTARVVLISRQKFFVFVVSNMAVDVLTSRQK